MASVIDNFLDTEVFRSPPMANLSHYYKNEMADPSIIDSIKQKQKKDPNNTYIYDDSLIGDDQIPKSFKSMGGQITRNVIYLKASLNKKGRLVLKDKYGIAPKKASLGGVYHSKTGDVEVNTYVLVFDKKSLENALNNPTSRADISQIKARYSSQGSLSILRHELKHAQNNHYLNLRNANPRSGKMGLHNIYRLLEDDEKSAKLEEVFSLIEAYYKSGESLAVFSNANNHLGQKVEELSETFYKEGKSKEELKAHLTKYFSNPEQLSKDSAAFWDKHYSKYYKANQFNRQMSYYTRTNPIHKIGNNNSIDCKEYGLRRKLLYTFEYYNPKTQKKERINLANKVPHTKITTIDKLSFLEPILNIASKKALLSLIPNYKKKLENKIKLSWQNRKENSKKYFKPKSIEKQIVEVAENVGERLEKLIKRITNQTTEPKTAQSAEVSNQRAKPLANVVQNIR